jgi:hypothetical protein
MSILGRLRVLYSVVLYLASAYVLLSLFRGIGALVGVSEPTDFSVLQTSLGVLLTLGIGLFVGAIVLVILIGYFALTGWRGFSRVPLIFKLLTSFLAGIVIFLVAMPLGAFLPVPLLPTVIVGIVAWLALRSLTHVFGPHANLGITVDRAEEIAQQLLQTHLNSGVAVTSTGSTLSGRLWKVSFRGTDNRVYEVNVDSQTGATLGWGAVAK